VYHSGSSSKSFTGSSDTSSSSRGSRSGSGSSTTTTTVQRTAPVWEDKKAMNNIFTKPGMFDKALHQFLDTGAIVNTDFHLQNLAGLYRGPEHFAMPSHSVPSVSEVLLPRSYKLNNPIETHSTLDQKISSSSDSSSTAEASRYALVEVAIAKSNQSPEYCIRSTNSLISALYLRI
jgi:hypothetical protein